MNPIGLEAKLKCKCCLLYEFISIFKDQGDSDDFEPVASNGFFGPKNKYTRGPKDGCDIPVEKHTDLKNQFESEGDTPFFSPKCQIVKALRILAGVPRRRS